MRKERFNKLPAQLKSETNWLVLKAKVAYSVKTGRPASPRHPDTWSNFELATALLESDASYDGIGFTITSPYVFVDLDHCRDVETEVIEEWAMDIVTHLDSYTELSPSRTGLHILCKSRTTVPPSCRKKGRVEMYDGQRYFKMTGDQLAGTSCCVEDRTEQFLTINNAIFGMSSPS